MMRSWLALVAIACACSFDPNGPASPNPLVDAQVRDGTMVDPPDGPPPVDAAQELDAFVDLCLQNTTACTTARGQCVGGACTIIEASAANDVTCPTGMPCRVLCTTGESSCQQARVDCAGATSCEVICRGDNACQQNGVDCGSASKCTVICDGGNACQHGVNNDSVECRASACTVTCKGSGSTCQDGIDPGTGSCTSFCCDGACSGGTCPTNTTTCP